MAASLADMIGGIDPRLSLLLAAAPTVGSAIWIVWTERTRRAEKREGQELTREEQRSYELDRQQASLGAETARWFGELRQELQAVKVERDLARKDANRGWDLARWWHGAAHDVLRAYRNCRHNALNMQQWINAAVQRHGIEMPEQIEPVPDRIDLPMGLEEPK